MIFREVEDRDLILRAGKGDVEAYNVLVSRWEKRVYNYLLRTVRNREDALDLCHTLRYGKDKVTKSDILNLSKKENPGTTIEADISSAPNIPSNSFDCIIFTQTLQLLYNFRAAIETLHRVLKPGGVLLATVPAISQLDARWCGQFFWRFSSASTELLFKEYFPDDKVETHGYGNILTAIGFLHGLALAELNEEELNYQDQSYEMLITIKATKNK